MMDFFFSINITAGKTLPILKTQNLAKKKRKEKQTNIKRKKKKRKKKKKKKRETIMRIELNETKQLKLAFSFQIV